MLKIFQKSMRACLAAVLVCLLALTTNAQNKTVTGKVTDAKNGSPLVGATVSTKPSGNATATKSDGSFSLSVKPGVTKLVISFTGYGDKEIAIDASGVVNLTMEPNAEQLQDVVVVGYGTVKSKDVTGALTSIKSKEFNSGVITSPDQLIQGKSAGVQIVNNSGAPGGGFSINIRGVSSIRSSSTPLVVIDGVPLQGGSDLPGFGTALAGTPEQNPLNFINPNDIASIDILKDASATAIYGSRGANGVIQITTKKGQAGLNKLEINSSIGVSSILKKIEVLNASQYVEALKKYGLSTALSTNSAPTGNGGANVDALNEILRTGLTNSHNIAFNGGNENGRYRLSLGYINQEGIVKNSGFEKLTAALTSSTKFFNKKLNIDFNLNVSQTKTQYAPISNNAGYQNSLIGAALQWNPTFSLYDSVGEPRVVNPQLANTTINPMALLKAYNDNGVATTVLTSFSPSYKITKWLEYRFFYSIYYGTGVRNYELKNWLNIDGYLGLGDANNSQSSNLNKTLYHTLTFDKEVANNVNLNIVGGFEYLSYNNKYTSQSGKGFTDYPGLHYYNYIHTLPNNNRVLENNENSSELQSYFVRANVNILDKYLITATARQDGSSRFGANNKYALFPSVGLAWNIKNEQIIEKINAISALKLRLGWGITGNQEFGDNQAAITRVNLGRSGEQTLAFVGNPDLKWEQTTSTNIGLDFGFAKNFVTGSIDYFLRQTKDALFLQSVAGPAPQALIYKNLPVTVDNNGIEIALNFAFVNTSKIRWNFGVNAGFIQNKVNGLSFTLDNGEVSGQGLTGAFAQRVASGYPINVYYLANWKGLDAEGLNNFENGSATEKFYQGSPNPTTLLGINTDFSIDKFTIRANLNGAFGHYLYNNTQNGVIALGNLPAKRNVALDYLNTTNIEKTSNTNPASNRFLEKGDYIKLTNLILSYNFGDIGKVLKGFSVSLIAQNVFVLTSFKGFDPEVNVNKSLGGVPSRGIEYQPYPSARTFNLAVNFNLY